MGAGNFLPKLCTPVYTKLVWVDFRKSKTVAIQVKYKYISTCTYCSTSCIKYKYISTCTYCSTSCIKYKYISTCTYCSTSCIKYKYISTCTYCSTSCIKYKYISTCTYCSTSCCTNNLHFQVVSQMRYFLLIVLYCLSRPSLQHLRCLMTQLGML